LKNYKTFKKLMEDWVDFSVKIGKLRKMLAAKRPHQGSENLALSGS